MVKSIPHFPASRTLPRPTRRHPGTRRASAASLGSRLVLRRDRWTRADGALAVTASLPPSAQFSCRLQPPFQICAPGWASRLRPPSSRPGVMSCRSKQHPLCVRPPRICARPIAATLTRSRSITPFGAETSESRKHAHQRPRAPRPPNAQQRRRPGARDLRPRRCCSTSWHKRTELEWRRAPNCARPTRTTQPPPFHSSFAWTTGWAVRLPAPRTHCHKAYPRVDVSCTIDSPARTLLSCARVTLLTSPQW